MGSISEAVFERAILPQTVIIRAGGYYPQRSRLFLNNFDSVETLRSEWCPYTYGKFGAHEYMVIFNVYGASTTLEIIRILKDGGVTNLLFLGSMFSKNLPIGEYVVLTEIRDRAGLVRLDTEKDEVVIVEPKTVERIARFYDDNEVTYHKAKIMSVPCVLHGIESIHNELASDETIEGVEMELSTYYHFGQKEGMNLYSFLYVSDNPSHHLLDTDLSVKEWRKKRMDALGNLLLRFGHSLHLDA